MNTLKVELGERSYPILIGEGLLRQSELVRQHVVARDILIVSNTTVAPLYMESLAAALGGSRVVEAILPDGEAHKTLTTVSRVLDVLVGNRFGRDCTVVALGGGVVGDMAGFAASCYQRGVPYVQVPTTLLAQVDSSVGGKTGSTTPAARTSSERFTSRMRCWPIPRRSRPSRFASCVPALPRSSSTDSSAMRRSSNGSK